MSSSLLPRELRRRLPGHIGVVLVLALGGGAALGALIAAERTDRAYPSYVKRAAVADLVANPSLTTLEMDSAIRHLPGVVTAHSDALLSASVSVTQPAPLRDLLDADPSLQVRGSTDRRYIDVDRPVITEGRFASGTGEVFVSEDYRSELDAVEGRRLKAGDTIDLAFWWSLIADAGIDPDQVVEPIGVEHLRIAGYGHLPDEVLPDELYPRRRLVVSADVAGRYSCIGSLRSDMSEEEAQAAGFPSTCASQYRYYALQLAPGDDPPASVHLGFDAAADRLGSLVPEALTRQGIAYYYIGQDRRDIDDAVRQVTRPTVAALVVFGVVAALATLIVAALVIARMLRTRQGEQSILRALGATGAERALIAASPLLVSVWLGVLASVLVGAAVSVVGPVGTVRVLTPDPTWSAPAIVVVPGALVMGALMTVVVGWLAWAAAQRARPSSARPRRASMWSPLAQRARPSMAHGVTAALSPRQANGSTAVVAGSVVAVAALVAALIFGSNLESLVREPHRYGWPWDVAVITGAGYGDTVPEAVAASLQDDPAVEGYSVLAFDSASTISGRTIPAVYSLPGTGATSLPLVAGRDATSPGEAVLGATSAHELDAHVGDRITIESPLGGLDVQVVGIAVLPSLGPFLADRAGLGVGVYAPIDLDAALARPEDKYPAALTGVRLRPGADKAAFLARITPALQGWDQYGAPPSSFLTKPVRAPAIVNADAVRAAPLALGALLGIGLVLGLSVSIGVSVRDRRRELAILRALGFSRRDLRATVLWQGLAIVAVGLALGVPVGIVAGRTAWRTFADELGVVPHAGISLLGLAAVGTGAVVLGIMASMPSARTAARISPLELLHNAQ